MPSETSDEASITGFMPSETSDGGNSAGIIASEISDKANTVGNKNPKCRIAKSTEPIVLFVREGRIELKYESHNY